MRRRWTSELREFVGETKKKIVACKAKELEARQLATKIAHAIYDTEVANQEMEEMVPPTLPDTRHLTDFLDIVEGVGALGG